MTYFYYLCFGYFALLSIGYLVSILLLNRRMKSLQGDFGDEIKTINLQFTFFLLAFVTHLIFYIIYFVNPTRIDSFQGIMWASSLNILWNIVPILYSLYSHRIIFKKAAFASECYTSSSGSKSKTFLSEQASFEHLS